MGTNILPAPAPRRRSTFNLPSFRRSSAAERQEVLKHADDSMARSNSVQLEAPRIQKAAAWQWYTRGAGAAVLLPRPTRPPVPNPQAPVSDDKSCVGAASGLRSTANVRDSSMPQEKTVNPPPRPESHRGVSRFKAESRLSFTGPAAGGAAPPTLPAGAASTPLYDELELSSLRTHMADFVQRLQHQDNPDYEHSLPARPPPPSCVSIDQLQTKAPPAVTVASAGDHQQFKTLPCSPAPVASSLPFRIKPFSALQKLFRKVLSGSVPRCTKNVPHTIDAASVTIYEPGEVPYNDIDEYHHHHYIHHHHHHYHLSKSPEEQASTILSRRRHSESGISRPCTPTLAEAGSDEEEDQDEVDERRIAAYLARRRRRRNSDSFARYQLLPEDANFDKDEGMKEEFSQVESPMQFWRRYNSERFLATRIPTTAGKDNTTQPTEDKFDEGAFAGIRSRRRHSAEFHRDKPSLAQAGGKSGRGAYVLGGGGAASITPASIPVVRRRHSESSKERPEAGAEQIPSPGRPYWISPSTRHYVIGVPTPLNAA